MNKFLKSNVRQFKFVSSHHGAKKCLMDYQIYAVSYLCRQMDIL